MTEIKQKMTVTQKMQATCPTHARTDISARAHESVIDEPESRGGTDLGLTPTETAMAALLGCTNTIANRIAHSLEVEFADFHIDMEADFDRRGVSLIEEVDVPFPEIRLSISVKTAATEDQMNEIRSRLSKFCPVAKLFRQAGTNVIETWNVTPA
jgi:uncharacterized OsmC-like protein|tara:strand:- start:3006 stop:3470 length:465 start_codon:yes stop_codon:yes gene_type:complete